MKLLINGEEKELAPVADVAALIAALGLKGDRIAVELNREIVTRSQWAATSVQDGDKLEIVQFVGGG